MSDETVVVYGAGASHASGYKLKINTGDGDYSIEPLMNECYFDQEPIKKLIENTYYITIG